MADGGPHGGASALNLLQHAVRAVQAGDAETIVLCSGDHLDRAAFAELVANYNRATRDQLAPFGSAGPNALFAMLTTRYLAAHGLQRADLGQIPVAQRGWAAGNPRRGVPRAADDPGVPRRPSGGPPLARFDCVPVVAGADAVVVTAAAGGPAARVRAVAGLHNPDDQEGDGAAVGLRRTHAGAVAGGWRRARRMSNAAFVYDDYPVMAAVQAADAGLIADGDVRRWLHVTLGERRWPLNTSGGQLSAGQAGAAGGMHGLVEAVTQLRRRAAGRQLDAELVLVTGYGMVLYRHGASHAAAVLQRVA